MNTYMIFIAQHWVLSSTLIVLLFMLLALELRGRMQGIRELSTQQATDLMNRADAVLIDVRDAAAYALGHILGARSIPMANLAGQLAQLEMYKTKPVILVCAIGQTSMSAAALLRKQGFSQVNNLTGGMNAWRTAGLPVVKV